MYECANLKSARADATHWHEAFNASKEQNDRLREELAAAKATLVAWERNLDQYIGEMNEVRDKNSELEKQLADFKCEWSNRFGYLATKNDRESIESIDEVAEIFVTWSPKELLERIDELKSELATARECVETCRLIEEHCREIFHPTGLRPVWSVIHKSGISSASTLHAAVRLAAKGGE